VILDISFFSIAIYMSPSGDGGSLKYIAIGEETVSWKNRASYTEGHICWGPQTQRLDMPVIVVVE